MKLIQMFFYKLGIMTVMVLLLVGLAVSQSWARADSSIDETTRNQVVGDISQFVNVDGYATAEMVVNENYAASVYFYTPLAQPEEAAFEALANKSSDISMEVGGRGCLMPPIENRLKAVEKKGVVILKSAD